MPFLSRWRALTLAAFGAGLYAAVIMAPIVRQPGSTLCAYDHPGDAMISIWSTWVRLEAQEGRWPLEKVPLVGAPEGVDFRQNPPEPALEWPQLQLARWLGEVRAYNLQLWLTFPLAAAFMALLMWELTGSVSASIVSGLIYACAPYHFAHSVQLSLASIQWLPLGLWSWLKLFKDPGIKRATIHTVCCLLLVGSTIYYGFIFAVASIAWVLGLCFLPPQAAAPSRRFLIWGTVSLLATSLVCWFWYRPFLHVAFVSPSLPFGERYAWALKHFFVYCAKPWDYFIPSLHHPWFGRIVRPFIESHLYGSNVTEQTLYLGYGALGLGLLALVRRRALKGALPQAARAVGLFACLAAIGLWFSGPPFVPLGAFSIEGEEIVARWALPFPSILLHHLLPFFRVYARFGLLVILSVAGLAGIGWAHGQRSLSPKKPLWVLGLGALGFLLVFEYALSMPIFRTDPVPEVYQWLAQQQGPLTIVEYPFLSSTHSLHAEYLFEQRFHQKPMLNGAFERTPRGQERLSLVNLMSADVPKRLSQLGARWVIVHRDRYGHIPPRPRTIRILKRVYPVPHRHWDEELPAPPLEIPGLKFVKSFGGSVVYRIPETGHGSFRRPEGGEISFSRRDFSASPRNDGNLTHCPETGSVSV